MAKKKKSRRKVQHKVHRTSRPEPTLVSNTAGSASAPVVAAASASAPVQKTATPKPAATPVAARTAPTAPIPASTSERWVYVSHDLRRVGIFALVCIILEAIVWVVLNHTSVGPALINSIKI
jgi:hypothetical protein